MTKTMYDMETDRMKKAIQDIIDDNKSRITQDRQDERHGDPADHKWVDVVVCPSCQDDQCQCGPDEDDQPDLDEKSEDWLDDVEEDTCPDCGDPICDCWLDDDNTETHWAEVKDGYLPLFDVLREALNQAQSGKGEERHGNGLSFMEQPALTITRAVGLGFPLGQAMKKIQECQRMEPDAAKRELLGAINYLAAAILFLDE